MIDNILISERIRASWLGFLPFAVQDLLKKYPDLTTNEIPDENFRELPDGSGELFIKIRDKEIKLKVPENEWKFK